MSKISHVKHGVDQLFNDIYKAINNTTEDTGRSDRNEKSELSRADNKIGLFTVDPYNFALTVKKIGNELYEDSDLNKDDYLKISYKLINILYNMSQITTSYSLDVNTINNSIGYDRYLFKFNRVKKMLQRIDLSNYEVEGNYDEFGKVVLGFGDDVQRYEDYFDPDKKGDYILNVSVGLNMAAIIFMYFHHHDRTLNTLKTNYNFAIYNTSEGNCAYYGESFTCYANNKELFKKFGIVDDTFNIHNNFHRICLMFNLYFYCFKQEFVYDIVRIPLSYYEMLTTRDDVYSEACCRTEHIWIGKNIDFNIDLKELYTNNQNYIKCIPINFNILAATKYNDSNSYSKNRTSKHVLVKRNDPVQAVPLVTPDHLYMAYIDKDKVIISDNNNTYTDDLVFEKSLDGLISALIALQKFIANYYGYEFSLFNSLPKYKSYINNLYYTFSSMNTNHILLDDFDNFGMSIFNLICLFYSKRFYVTYCNCFVSRNDRCLIMFEQSTRLFDLSTLSFTYKFEEDTDVKSVIEIINDIKTKENTMKQYQKTLSKNMIGFIKDLCDKFDIKITSDKDLLKICNLEMSSYMIKQLKLESIYISDKSLQYGNRSSFKLQHATILNDCIAITDFDNYNNRLIIQTFNVNTTFKNICNQYVKPTKSSFNHNYIFSIKDSETDAKIKYMISQLQDRIIDGHNTVKVEDNMDKIYLLFAIAYDRNLPCKCVEGDNTQFIIDFSDVCKDIAEHIFGHNCYVYDKGQKNRVRANSIIRMYGGNFINYLSWLIILIIVIVVIILIQKSDIIKLLVN